MSARRPGFPARLDSAAPAAPPARAGKAATAAGASVPPVRSPVAQPARTPATLEPVRGLGLDSAAVRARMVQRLAAQGVRDEAVLAAMAQVERHRFVDTGLAAQAYEDTSLPIGFAQTISKPSVVARMLALLREGEIRPLGRVLEIGTGCGYQAAVLSQIAREVYSVERIRGLYERAQANLRPLRLANVHLILGDGMLGFAQGAPYSAIISAAGAGALPQAWIEQLAVGGRLVAPEVTAQGTQALVVIDKRPQGLVRTVLEAVHFVPLKSGLA